MFYVYVHRRKDTLDVFYVGKGVGKRAWKHAGRNEWWHRVVKKYGRTVEIVKRFDDEDLAFELEKELIAFYGRDKVCNLTDGGMGGVAVSEETRAKMSAARKGRKVSEETREKMRRAATGRRHSEETKAKLREYRLKQVMPPLSEESRRKLSASKKGVPAPESMKIKLSQARKGVPTGRKMTDANKKILRDLRVGKPLSEETKKKLADKARGRSHSAEVIKRITENNRRLNSARRKPIECSNGLIFSYSGEAQEWLRANGFPAAQKTNIVSCCKGKLKTAYGYVWRYHKMQ